MAENQDPKPGVFFQTVTLTFLHPRTGDKIVRNFVGRAIFTPEELVEFGDAKLEDIFHNMELDKPYNPYEDENNVEAHRALTDKVREAMDNDS